MEPWADALKERRLQFGMSQQDVVAASGAVLYQAEVSRLERGVVHPTEDISLEKFFALLKALEWTLEDFAEATGLTFPFSFASAGGGAAGGESARGHTGVAQAAGLRRGRGGQGGRQTLERRTRLHPARETARQGC